MIPMILPVLTDHAFYFAAQFGHHLDEKLYTTLVLYRRLSNTPGTAVYSSGHDGQTLGTALPVVFGACRRHDLTRFGFTTLTYIR